MDTFKALTDFYSNYDEEGRLLSKHGQVEFLTTMRYIEKYLHSGMKILEIGAATGRYSHTLARMGYQVEAVELIQHNIDIFNTLTQPGEDIHIRQGNAMDLSFFGDDTFDMTLLLGPMYHLFTEEEQKKALSEAIRVTKKGGIVMAAYCGNDSCLLHYGFGKGELLQPESQGMLNEETFMLSHSPTLLFQLYRIEDIDALMKNFHTQRLHFVGTDMATKYMQNTVDEMDDAFFSLYLKYHFTICERPDRVGISHHFLDVFRKL
jgi:2-polyprenyl-3-methyl-5-hydroxy-6-metoxy-1,4-benzoquinol methylase